MPDLEELLRDTMQRRRDEAPAPVALLIGARRRHRRRIAASLAAVAITVTGVIVGAVAITRDGSSGAPHNMPVIPALDAQGSMDDSLFAVPAPMLSLVVGGVPPQPKPACDLSQIDARGELREVYDGVVGAVALHTSNDCSIFVNGTPRLVDADGHALNVPFTNPKPMTGAADTRGFTADFNAGDGRIGFAWRGSWCGPSAAALELPLSDSSGPNAVAGPTLHVPLTGPSPSCTGNSSSNFVPGFAQGTGWPTRPLNSGVLPAEPAWSALNATVHVDSITTATVRATVTLHNTGDQDVILQPCPDFTISIDFEYPDGSFAPEHDATFPCGLSPVIPAHEDRTYQLPELPTSQDEDNRTPTQRILSFAITGIPEPTPLNIPTP